MRPNGHYWVKLDDNEWTVAYYGNGMWCFIGNDAEYKDDTRIVIEQPIQQPNTDLTHTDTNS
jgi:hypothetical protein